MWGEGSQHKEDRLSFQLNGSITFLLDVINEM